MICVSLPSLPFEDCRELLKLYDCVEVRFDLGAYDEERVQSIVSAHSNLIATCRAGVFTEVERLRLLNIAIQAGAAYIDLEMESDAATVAAVKELMSGGGVSLIVSYHNYEGTPDLDTLKGIIQQCRGLGADIVKVACMPKSYSDLASLLAIYDADKDLIVVPMGRLGQPFRIIAPLLGSKFTYASHSVSLETAPGQIPYKQLKELYEAYTSCSG